MNDYDTNKELWMIIRALRGSRGISQVKLSRLLGKYDIYIHNCEAARNPEMSVITLFRVLDKLHVNKKEREDIFNYIDSIVNVHEEGPAGDLSKEV